MKKNVWDRASLSWQHNVTDFGFWFSRSGLWAGWSRSFKPNWKNHVSMQSLSWWNRDSANLLPQSQTLSFKIQRLMSHNNTTLWDPLCTDAPCMWPCVRRLVRICLSASVFHALSAAPLLSWHLNSKAAFKWHWMAEFPHIINKAFCLTHALYTILILVSYSTFTDGWWAEHSGL